MTTTADWPRSLSDIGYITEPVEVYQKSLSQASTLAELLGVLSDWRCIASDAHEIAQEMDMLAFGEFRAGLKKERKGQFAGEPWAQKYSAILMPLVMFQVSLVAEHFHAPWGTAYIRLREEGQIIEQDGVASWKENKS